ncbi:flagellin [Dinoroseobacter sp. S124A]|uniref:flagellin n=1 Tax=Dinoroseobacter sp. S124A TaxID=3415128 RepID=UPI003C7CB3FA
MISTSIGDLAQTMSNRMQMTRLKSNLGTLTYEMSSGKKEDIASEVRGEFSAVSALEGSLKTLAAYENSVTEGVLLFDTAQASLTLINDLTVEAGPNLILSSEVSDPAMLKAAGEDAEQKLATVVSALNVSVSGRAIFGGAATDGSPLISAEEIMDELTALVAGAPTPADALALVDSWFSDAGGGFETLAYQGSADPMTAIPVGPDERLAQSITAADPAIREVMSSFASAALVARGAFDGDAQLQADLIGAAGEAMLSSETGLSVIQAELGAQQAFLDGVSGHLDTQKSTYQMALNEIYAADPYEVATQLEAVALQLETMYAVTSRLSSLSMTEYLR